MNKVISFFKKPSKGNSFEALLAPHMDSLYRQSYQYTGSTHDAEDLLQDLLIELFQKQNQLKAAKSPRAWLTRCLYHRFIDGYRKQKSTPEFDDINDELTSNKLLSLECPANTYWHQEVIAGLSLLTKDQRTTINLHDIEGFTLAEVSEITEMPIGTLKSHLHRGRKMMQKRLNVQPCSSNHRL